MKKKIKIPSRALSECLMHILFSYGIYTFVNIKLLLQYISVQSNKYHCVWWRCCPYSTSAPCRRYRHAKCTERNSWYSKQKAHRTIIWKTNRLTKSNQAKCTSKKKIQIIKPLFSVTNKNDNHFLFMANKMRSK